MQRLIYYIKYWFNPKMWRERSQRQLLIKINRLKAKQVKAKQIGEDTYWLKLEHKVKKLSKKAGH